METSTKSSEVGRFRFNLRPGANSFPQEVSLPGGRAILDLNLTCTGSLLTYDMNHATCTLLDIEINMRYKADKDAGGEPLPSRIRCTLTTDYIYHHSRASLNTKAFRTHVIEIDTSDMKVHDERHLLNYHHDPRWVDYNMIEITFQFEAC